MRRSLTAFLSGVILLLSSVTLSPSASAAEHDNWISFTNEGFSSCSGEEVLVSGRQHVVGQTNVDASGREHFVFHRNTFGTGIGTVSGAEYLLRDSVAKTDLLGTNEGDVTVFNQLSVGLIIRKGETAPHDDNFVQIMTRYTITPDGTLTGDIDILSPSCR